MKRAIILMADEGQDPTETVVPYDELRRRGYEVHFATAHGAVPHCDARMLRGWTQKLLGAPAAVVKSHDEQMIRSAEYGKPLAWEEESFSLRAYDIVWLPGGHDKRVRQMIESTRLHALLAEYMDLCRESASASASVKSTAKHCLAAICHGPLVLSEGRHPTTGKSLLYNATATGLPAAFEAPAYHATRLFLGDYYKTYGAGSANVETMMRNAMKDDAKQWKSSSIPTPFVVVDDKLNLLTGRFPPDALPLVQRAIELVR